MAQFQVPQFIDIEQKIIGGLLTMRQFLFVAAGFAIAFGLLFIVRFLPWLILTIIIAAITFALAFVKISGRPLISILKAAFTYYWNPSFYIWRSEGAPEFKIPETKTVFHKTHEKKEVSSPLAEQIKSKTEKSKVEAIVPKEIAKFREQIQRAEEKISAFAQRLTTHQADEKESAPPNKSVEAPPDRIEQKKIQKSEIHTVQKIEPQALVTTEKSEVTTIEPKTKIPREYGGLQSQIPQAFAKPGKLQPGPKEIRERLKIGRQVQGLWEKITTFRELIPKREKQINGFRKQRLEEEYRLMRKAAGDIEIARRVDFK